MKRNSGFTALVALAMFTLFNPAQARPSVSSANWTAYKAAFVSPQGRVIDNGNGNISHSEGQGYGLLLSYLADDAAAFDLIWSFTRTELLLRDDGLAMWKWDPVAETHITDPNNATDGDILIAYALALAGQGWQRSDLTIAASRIAKAVGNLVKDYQGRTILLPGVEGYGKKDRQDGPVVNLSYWIFEAFPVLSQLAPDTDWQALSQNGVALLKKALLGPRSLPPDWLSVRTWPRPADGFAAEFGYNSFRIPLYLLRGGIDDRSLLSAIGNKMTNDQGQVVVVDIKSGAVKEALADPGYTIIPQVISCVLEKKPISNGARAFTPTLYYPSTLHLLGLSFLSEHYPGCLK